MKKRRFSVFPFLFILIGVSFLLYPTVSNYVNQKTQSAAAAVYEKTAAELDDSREKALWSEAVAYNESLQRQAEGFVLTGKEREEYDRILNTSGTGIMGIIRIPELHVSLPIYHGTDEGVLQIAAGHFSGSSLPVGGPGTHCVLSGHSGLPSARLFTDLDQLKPGDRFELYVLRNILIYEVDQISIVLPQDLGQLKIKKGEDLCTLVTCTPYGVNTHRLLVRGHRVTQTAQEKGDLKEAFPAFPWPAFCAILLVSGAVLLTEIVLYIGAKRKRGCKRKVSGWKRAEK